MCVHYIDIHIVLAVKKLVHALTDWTKTSLIEQVNMHVDEVAQGNMRLASEMIIFL